MFDTHLHTTFSCDSKMSSQEAIEHAKQKGLGIIITEHLDLDYPENPEEFVFDFEEYFTALEPYRNENMLLGVELGLRIDCADKNRQVLKGWPFDEIVGSIHVVDGIDIYRPEFTKSRTKKQSYGRYFEIMLDCVNDFDEFDTLGHVDYICRYAAYEDPEIYLEDFYDEWTSVCQSLIAKEKALELNTRRLASPLSVNTLKPLYKRYHELGGRYITIASDAHRLTDIGANFLTAWQFAEQLDLQPVYFRERKMLLDKR